MNKRTGKIIIAIIIYFVMQFLVGFEQIAYAEEMLSRIPKINFNSTENIKIERSTIIKKGYVNLNNVEIRLNVRSGPSTSYTIIGKLYHGDEVQIVDDSNSSWYKIKFGSGYGYVSKDYIKISATIVTVSDSNLAIAINKALGKASPYNQLITKEELQKLRSLNISNSNIKSLSGLEYATNLQTLNIYNNSITDLTPLAKLTQLTTLDAMSNQISNIIPLKSLTKLTKLALNYNNISDISAIANLTNLIYLYISDNNIVNVASLGNLKNLQELNLKNNNISNLSSLTGLTSLTYINLCYNNITDISPIAKLTTLKKLHFYNNTVSDISSFKTLINLEDLYADNNKIRSVDSLAELNTLKRIIIYDNEISDISALSKLTNLISLNITRNKISDLSSLKNLSKLETLSASSQTITLSPEYVTTGSDLNLSVSFLKNKDGSIPTTFTSISNLGTFKNNTITWSNITSNTTCTFKFTGNNNFSGTVNVPVQYRDTSVNIPDLNLRKAINKSLGKASPYTQEIGIQEMERIIDLNISSSNIQNLTGLEYAINLKELYAQGNSISDLKPIKGLSRLRDLNLCGNLISDITPLNSLVNLENLHCYSNNISDITALRNLSKLKYLYLNSNKIENINSLGNLTNLKGLYLSNNNINDITSLSKLVNLEILDIGSNEIEDISSLGRLVNLTNLYIGNNKIKDISSLSSLSKLKTLNASNQTITLNEDEIILGRIFNLSLNFLKNKDGSQPTSITNISDLGTFNTNIITWSNLKSGKTLTFKFSGKDNFAGIVNLPIKYNGKVFEGDFNEDGYVDIVDLSIQSLHYDKPVSGDFLLKLDLNKDNVIDIFDIVALSKKIDEDPSLLGKVNISNEIDEDNVVKTRESKIAITGTAEDEDGIVQVKYEISSPISGIKKGQAIGLENWSVDVEPTIGSNTLRIILVDKYGFETIKTICLDRLSTNIELNEDVWIPDNDEIIDLSDSVVDSWIEEDGTILVLKEDSSFVRKLKSRSVKPSVNSIIMIEPCTQFLTGFTGKVIETGEPEKLLKNRDYAYPEGITTYANDQYQYIKVESPSMEELFNEDVRIDFSSEGIDGENPLAFAILPNGSSIYGESNGSTFELYDSLEKSISSPGFQWENVLESAVPEISYSGNTINSIGINLNDDEGNPLVLYDKDGNDETEEDRIFITGRMGIEDFTAKGGIEWHPSLALNSFDILPQQILFKAKYNFVREIGVEFGNEVANISEIVKEANAAINSGFDNETSFLGLKVQGVEMGDSLNIGCIGINLSMQPVFGDLGQLGKQSKIQPIAIIMLTLDMEGKIGGNISLSFKNNIYNEVGFNIQKDTFTGAFGSINDNRGQKQVDLPFGRSLQIYDIQAKSSSEIDKKPVTTVTLEGNAEVEAGVGIGPKLAIMYGGIIPVTTKFVGYSHFGANINGGVQLEGTSIEVFGQGSYKFEVGIKATINLLLKVKNEIGLPNVSLDWDSEWKHKFIELSNQFSKVSLRGKVVQGDYDTDITNNKILQGANIKLVKKGVTNPETYTATSDKNGNYNIKDIKDGEYKLTVTKSGYADLNKDIEIDGDTTLDIIMDPVGNSTLQGKITLADTDTDMTNNSPINGAKVKIKKIYTTTEINKTVTTDANGNYSINNLLPGLYELTVESNGCIPLKQNVKVYENQANIHNATLEVISSGNSGSGTASGSIIDALSGKKVPQGITLLIRSGVNNTDGNIISTLYTNTTGGYVVVLPAGNYTVQVIDERANPTGDKYKTGVFNIKVLGNTDIGNQNGIITPILNDGEIRIVLKWGSKPKDLDSHLVGPTADGNSKFHTYYKNQGYSVGGNKHVALDVDERYGYGPETTTIYKQTSGIYKFYVHNFTHRSLTEDKSPDESAETKNNRLALANSGARVIVHSSNDEEPMEFSVPNSEGTLWEVFEYDSNTKKIKGINNMTYHSDPKTIGSRTMGLNLDEILPDKEDTKNKEVFKEKEDIKIE